MKTDTTLSSDVVDELAFDPAVDASKIAVAVHDGIVTLRGPVPSLWQKVEAEDAVKRVTGVRGVANDLSVEIGNAQRRDDSDIARAAANALAWHSDLPGNLNVSVDEGWITLSGKVDWQYQKDEAADAVRYLMGVKGVINDITLRIQPKVANILDKIRAELNRTVDEEVNRIVVTSTNGTVTLRGTVHSWSDLDAADRAAWSVPGVTDVDNDLVVSS